MIKENNLRLEDQSKMVQTMVKKFLKPGMTVDQAYELYRQYMRANASKGGQNGTGNQFAHGKISPSEAGKKGSKVRWGNE